MTSNEVATVLAQAATYASLVVRTNSVIAVVDREGFVLGLWSVNGIIPNTNACNGFVAEAIGRAGTAAFLSSDEQALTSRTALMIVQQHFPPGVANRPPGPLVGVNFSQLVDSDVNRYKNPAGFVPGMNGGTNGTVVATPCLGGLDGLLGGVPLYRGGTNLIGGVGVAGDDNKEEIEILDRVVLQRDVDEEVALAGQIGFAPKKKFRGSHVFIDGIRVPYVIGGAPKLANVAPLGSLGINVPGFPITNSPTVDYPKVILGGVPGELRAPIIDDPTGNLTAADVTEILTEAARRSAITRAGIRLPRGKAAQVFITVVNNPNADGIAPVILGTFRTREATIFSWDVAIQKARTALYFSGPFAASLFPPGLPTRRAYSTRAVGFLAQSLYPPGIARTAPGPFFGLQETFSNFTGKNPLNDVVVAGARDPNLPNGITIFPGGFPLYRDGELIGGIGVSGDGIDQDDIIGASGAALFPPPSEMRSDQIIFRGARLPYAKFPRNPNL